MHKGLPGARGLARTTQANDDGGTMQDVIDRLTRAKSTLAQLLERL